MIPILAAVAIASASPVPPHAAVVRIDEQALVRRYLERHKIRGQLLKPIHRAGFVSWKNYPRESDLLESGSADHPSSADQVHMMAPAFAGTMDDRINQFAYDEVWRMVNVRNPKDDGYDVAYWKGKRLIAIITYSEGMQAFIGDREWFEQDIVAPRLKQHHP